jgi:hypothetical protein
MIPREDSKSDIRTTKEISYNISNEKPRTTFPLHLAQNFITSAKQRERTTPLQIDNRTGVPPGSSQHRATHTHTHTPNYTSSYTQQNSTSINIFPRFHYRDLSQIDSFYLHHLNLFPLSVCVSLSRITKSATTERLQILESSQKNTQHTHTHTHTHESEIYLPMPVLEPVTIATRLESFILCLRAIAEKQTSTATVHSEPDKIATPFRRGGIWGKDGPGSGRVGSGRVRRSRVEVRGEYRFSYYLFNQIVM